MKQERSIMGMTVAVELVDEFTEQKHFDLVFDYFTEIDEQFSTYKKTSEISRINAGEISSEEMSEKMNEVFSLSGETKRLTNGFFDIRKPDGLYDPSGLVKGWAINNATGILSENGVKNFFLSIGGDVQVKGKNAQGKSWMVGIRNPFDTNEVVKIVHIQENGIATSGNYERGKHIYDPHRGVYLESEILSMTVIGPNIYEADRFATAAFAMGKDGITFIEQKEGLEGYAIDKNGIATMTSHFDKYTENHENN